MRIATLLVSLAILIALLYPGEDLPDVRIGNWDKVIHLVMFATWTVAVRYDWRQIRLPLWRMLLFGAGFAFATEVLQTLVEGRSFDPIDWAADLAGVFAGWMISRPVIASADRFINYLCNRSGRP